MMNHPGGIGQLAFNPVLDIGPDIGIDKQVAQKHGQKKNRRKADQKLIPDLNGMKKSPDSGKRPVFLRQLDSSGSVHAAAPWIVCKHGLPQR